MEFETLPIVIGLAGVVLLYGAVRNRRVDDVVRLALQGKDIATARPISAPPGITPGQGPVGPDVDPNEPGVQNNLAPGPGGLGGPTPMPPGGLPPGTVSYQPGQSGLVIRNPYLGKSV